MELKEIENIFSEIGVKAPDCNVYRCKLLEVKATLENDLKIIIFYGEAPAFIDLSRSYIGLGDTLLPAAEHIKSLEVKSRR